LVKVSAGFLSLVLGAAPAAAQGVIDMHVHAMSKDPRWTMRTGNPVTGQAMVAADESSHREATFAAFRKYHIVKAMVSGDFDAVLRWKQIAPDLIIAGYSFNAPDAGLLNILRKEIKLGRVQVLGEIGAQYGGILPNDPRLEPFFALAEASDIPIAYHAHPGPPGAPYVGFSKMRAAHADPLLFEEVLVRHPKLRIYIMHAGWPMLDHMIALMWQHPQVYVDLGIIDWSLARKEFHRYLRSLVDAGFGKRIMFGSDQMVWPEAIGMAIENIASADFLSPEQRDDILYHNAARFLRMEPPSPIPPGANKELPR